MASFVDLTQPIENGMTYRPGDPAPQIRRAAMEPPWRVSELHLGTHTGTHVDAPAHLFDDARTIDRYPLGRFWYRVWSFQWT